MPRPNNSADVFVPLRERSYPRDPNRPRRVPSFINESGQVEEIATGGTTTIQQPQPKDPILGVVKNGIFGI